MRVCRWRGLSSCGQSAATVLRPARREIISCGGLGAFVSWARALRFWTLRWAARPGCCSRAPLRSSTPIAGRSERARRAASPPAHPHAGGPCHEHACLARLGLRPQGPGCRRAGAVYRAVDRPAAPLLGRQHRLHHRPAARRRDPLEGDLSRLRHGAGRHRGGDPGPQSRQRARAAHPRHRALGRPLSLLSRCSIGRPAVTC